MQEIEVNKIYPQLTKAFNDKKRFCVQQGGTRCLSGDTLISTPSGSRCIANIEVGDTVLTPIGERKVTNTFRYGGADLAQSLLCFNYNGRYITCTREHRFLTEKGYVTADELAKRAVEDGAWFEWSLLHIFDGEVSDNESLRSIRTQGKGVDYETRFGWSRLPENEYQVAWEVQDNKDAQASGTAFLRKSRAEGTSQSHRWRQIQQRCIEFGVGDSQGEHRTRHEQWIGREYKGITQWYELLDGRYCGRNKVSVYPLQGDGEGLGERVWGVNGLREGLAQRANVESCYFDPQLVHSVTDGGREDVYDIEVEGTSCYILNDFGIVSHNSGKSYNILLWIIFYYCEKFNGRLITITRNTSPTLRNTIMRDFFEILERTGKYQSRYHNKTNWEYKLFGNTVQFLAVDSGQKIRGGKRDLLFMNEANEISLDAYQQLNFRTKEFIIMDYNPSEAYHWIYDRIIDQPDCAFHKSTYLDNPWLPEAQVKEIEKLMETDEAYWQIYGLGERAEIGNLVFGEHSTTDYIPPTADFVGYGMDFGYTVDPTALIAVYSDGDSLYFKEKFYRNELSGDGICEMLLENEVDRHHVIYADQADPRLVDHIKGRGWNIIGVGKGRDSIRGGIDLLKRKKLYIHESSSNLLREFRMYKWKESKDGKPTQDPIDGWNHGIDAIRYWALGALKRANYGKYRFA